MIINDIKIGGTYTLHFESVTANIREHHDNSEEFVSKHGGVNWSTLQGKRIVILKRIGLRARFHLEDDPPTYYTALSANYFKLILGSSSFRVACQCNLWISGCKCGVFKAEQAHDRS